MSEGQGDKSPIEKLYQVLTEWKTPDEWKSRNTEDEGKVCTYENVVLGILYGPGGSGERLKDTDVA